MSRASKWMVAGVLTLLTLGALIWSLNPRPRPEPVEVAVRLIPLRGGAEVPEAEISSLAWHGQTLVLLPQYPERFPMEGAELSAFTLSRSAIAAFLDQGSTDALEVGHLPIRAGSLEAQIGGFDGFEAIAFLGDRVFVTVETTADADHVVGWLVAGSVVEEEIRLDPTQRVQLRSQIDLENIGYEALVVRGDELWVLYETNGQINPRPVALVFDHELNPLREERMPRVEYRLTDATEADRRGRFWVSNYHWPGAAWQTASCRLTEEHGEGQSHARCVTVERLVELSYTERGVEVTRSPPIQLELVDDEHARNWEGLVRLPGRGFLMVTDEHPNTLLGFVPSG